MVEGKDRPKECPVDPTTTDHGKTGGLFLCLTCCLIGRGCVVILDSDFCVLKALLLLKKVGIFASALIEKRCNWPFLIPGNAIAFHFKDREVGSTESQYGVLDGVPYGIFCMKGPDYIMKVMSTYGAITSHPDQKLPKWVFKNDQGEWETITFQYTEPFANHFNY
eukprot:10244824-Ditylum_brightwellii.AAC.1